VNLGGGEMFCFEGKARGGGGGVDGELKGAIGMVTKGK